MTMSVSGYLNHAYGVPSAEIKALGAGAAGTNLDVLDPESLIAFFEMKMKDAKSKLNSLLQEQQTTINKANALQNLQGLLEGHPDGIHPGDADWDRFVKAANDAKEAVGPDSKEGNDIQALLDKANAPTDNVHVTASREEAYALADKYGVNVIASGGSTNAQLYTVVVPDGAPAGLSKSDVEQLKAEANSASTMLQSDEQVKMVYVQQLVDQCSQITSFATNITRKLDEMAMAPINNIRT